MFNNKLHLKVEKTFGETLNLLRHWDQLRIDPVSQFEPFVGTPAPPHQPCARLTDASDPWLRT